MVLVDQADSVRLVGLLFRWFLAEGEQRGEHENQLEQTEAELSAADDEVQLEHEPLPDRPVEKRDDGDQRENKAENDVEDVLRQISVDDQFQSEIFQCQRQTQGEDLEPVDRPVRRPPDETFPDEDEDLSDEPLEQRNGVIVCM